MAGMASYVWTVFIIYSVLNQLLPAGHCESQCLLHLLAKQVFKYLFLSSVQFSHSVVSDSSRPRGLQHARLPCPSPTPGACSNSCPLSQWCHPTISSSVVPFSSAFNISQYQGLFQGITSLHQVAKLLELQLQHQSFQWIFRIDLL